MSSRILESESSTQDSAIVQEGGIPQPPQKNESRTQEFMELQSASSSPAKYSNEVSAQLHLDQSKSIVFQSTQVQGSIATKLKWDRFCFCQCHKVTKWSIPTTFGQIIGQLLIGYAGLPFRKQEICDQAWCHRQVQAIMKVTYRFPLWLSLKILLLTASQTSTSFKWVLNIPRVVNAGDVVFKYAKEDSLDGLQSLIHFNGPYRDVVDHHYMASQLHVSKDFFCHDDLTLLTKYQACYRQLCNEHYIFCDPSWGKHGSRGQK